MMREKNPQTAFQSVCCYVIAGREGYFFQLAQHIFYSLVSSHFESI
jgi:hypothetical protein